MTKKPLYNTLKLLSIALIILSVIACNLICLAPALASTSNGVVENNILTNNNFINNDNITTNSNNTTIISYNPLQFKSTSNWGYIKQLIPITELDTASTYTLTAYIKTGTAGVKVYIGLRSFNNGTSVSGFSLSRDTTSTTYTIVSLTINLASYTYTNINQLGVLIYCNGSGGTNNICTAEWWKLEKGSEFTGYVKKDYENYGYNQGVNDGYISGSTNKSNWIKQYQINDTYDNLDGNSYETSVYYNGIETYSQMQNTAYYLENGIWKHYIINDMDENTGYFLTLFNTELTEEVYLDIYLPYPKATNITSGNLKPNIAIYNTNTKQGINYEIMTDNPYIQKEIYGENAQQYNLHVQFQYKFQTEDIYKIGLIGVKTTGGSPVIANSGDGLDTPAYFTPLTIYTKNASEYDAGYKDGKYKTTKEMEEKISEAFDKGKTAGIQQANSTYTDGYNDGLATAQNGSFWNLMYSVVNAPVKAILGDGTRNNTGLLNFEILGVNMSSFVMSILTLVLIIAIVKLIMKAGG